MCHPAAVVSPFRTTAISQAGCLRVLSRLLAAAVCLSPATAISRTDGIVANSAGGGIGITTGGSVTRLTGTGITTNSGSGSQMLQLNHNVTGATHGLNLTSTGTINVTNLAILTGGTNAILGSGNVFGILNVGTINGDINVTSPLPTFSGMNNAGTWNTGTGNSTIDGSLSNGGI